MLRFFFTVIYLKPVQVYGRILFKISRPSLDLSLPPITRKQHKAWCSSIERSVCQTGLFEFKFLNVERALSGPEDWNNSAWGKLWLYNLHYFNELGATNAQQRKSWHIAYIEKWIDENPPAIGNGWEPYTISLRVVNWIKWALAGNTLKASYVNSLATQVRYLSNRLEVHLLGNHLFANAKALFFAGLFFDGEEAINWFNKGTNILNEQIDEQILADGGHFERSPMYHTIVLEDLLDIINVAQVYNHEIPKLWLEKVRLMGGWLKSMCHPDGDISFFNDSAKQIAAEPHAIFQYFRRLNISPDSDPIDILRYLQSSGYVRIEKGPAVMLLDVAPIGPDYLPAHAHADTLSFELSYKGKRLLVNSGTSVYADCAERHAQRSTFAHNTLCIDDQNSSDTWGAFRVGRRAKVFDINTSSLSKNIEVSAKHSGYLHLTGSPIHRRNWQINQSELVIKDSVIGAKRHNLKINFYFHPDYRLEEIDNCIKIKIRNDVVVARIFSDPKMHTKIMKSTYHPEFGLSQQNYHFVCEYSGNLPFDATTRFEWS